MRQPAHGCNVRAKRLTHWLLAISRRLQPCWSLCQGDWLAITAADLQQTRPVCSRDESKSRRYSPRASRSMPEPPSKKIYTTEGWIRRDLATCFLASLGFPFAQRAYANERTAHEAPRLHRRKLRWQKSLICKPRIDIKR